MFPSSALKLRDELARGEISSRELTEHYLNRIEQHQDLGAFVHVAEDVMSAAHAADEAQVRGELGRLHGLPTAFKDLNDVTGMPTTYGSAAVDHPVASRDHCLVQRLRAEGVVILGKTQVPEFGLSSHSENLVAPPSRNPFDPGRSSGGSSGGQAAAIAAGMIPLGPGSDGGGSVRIPAAACGLIGLSRRWAACPQMCRTGTWIRWEHQSSRSPVRWPMMPWTRRCCWMRCAARTTICRCCKAATRTA